MSPLHTSPSDSKSPSSGYDLLIFVSVTPLRFSNHIDSISKLNNFALEGKYTVGSVFEGVFQLAEAHTFDVLEFLFLKYPVRTDKVGYDVQGETDEGAHKDS